MTIIALIHILPIAQEGTNDLNNLALACFHCNRRKTNQTNVLDPQTEQVVSLFNPRHDRWNDHFIWSADGLRLIGLTSIGRATIAALDLNRVRVISIRAADLEIGRHPPIDDPIQSSTS